ncbi:Proteasome subunit alpha type-4 [Platanthera guangdongensis]|uniref:Proteasome subunit alpha type-4 n=1 Tax=Platanthera guangdongensis TaxID=2320717 RepID=A0ABR2MDV6_9ASPA
MLATDGVVLVGEIKVTSKLLHASKSSEKMYKIDDHLTCAVANIMSDMNILINITRLYINDPGSNYSGWKTAAIGANNQAAQSMLKQDYTEDLCREEVVNLALKFLSKTVDSTSLTSDKLELSEIFLLPSGEVKYRVCSPKGLTKLLLKSGVNQPTAEPSAKHSASWRDTTFVYLQKRSKTNVVNRSHMSFTHTSGSKSYHSRWLEMGGFVLCRLFKKPNVNITTSNAEEMDSSGFSPALTRSSPDVTVNGTEALEEFTASLCREISTSYLHEETPSLHDIDNKSSAKSVGTPTCSNITAEICYCMDNFSFDDSSVCFSSKDEDGDREFVAKFLNAILINTEEESPFEFKVQANSTEVELATQVYPIKQEPSLDNIPSIVSVIGDNVDIEALLLQYDDDLFMGTTDFHYPHGFAPQELQPMDSFNENAMFHSSDKSNNVFGLASVSHDLIRLQTTFHSGSTVNIDDRSSNVNGTHNGEDEIFEVGKKTELCNVKKITSKKDMEIASFGSADKGEMAIAIADKCCIATALLTYSSMPYR